MAIQEGDKIPEATVHHMTDAGPTPITTSELFSGKRSVLFAVPGAFTPGCSIHHLIFICEKSKYLTHHMVNINGISERSYHFKVKEKVVNNI